MNKDQTIISLVKEAVSDGLRGNLDPMAALFAINMILNTTSVTEEDIQVARLVCQRYNLPFDESAKL